MHLFIMFTSENREGCVDRPSPGPHCKVFSLFCWEWHSALFNCAMNVVFENWKCSLRKEGLYVKDLHERLTNTRYADDILLYAKSLEELERMLELLIIELDKVGLKLNSAKTKILHSSCEDDESNFDFIEVSGKFIRILHPGAHHRYLGRQLLLLASNRIDIEFSSRV